MGPIQVQAEIEEHAILYDYSPANLKVNSITRAIAKKLLTLGLECRKMNALMHGLAEGCTDVSQ
jgi:hypothetical protein